MNKYLLVAIATVVVVAGAFVVLANRMKISPVGTGQMMKDNSSVQTDTDSKNNNSVGKESSDNPKDLVTPIEDNMKGNTEAAKNAVTIANFTYSPVTLTIKVGDSVTWTNNDSATHTATADTGSFDTGNLTKGQSKTITFTNKGTFTYHCTFHPNMKGTLIVE